MDTSKKYYEDKIRDFNRYRRGRTLAEFCRDQGIGYEWMQKAKRKYSGRTQPEKTEESIEEGKGQACGTRQGEDGGRRKGRPLTPANHIQIPADWVPEGQFDDRNQQKLA